MHLWAICRSVGDPLKHVSLVHVLHADFGRFRSDRVCISRRYQKKWGSLGCLTTLPMCYHNEFGCSKSNGQKPSEDVV